MPNYLIAHRTHPRRSCSAAAGGAESYEGDVIGLRLVQHLLRGMAQSRSGASVKASIVKQGLQLLCAATRLGCDLVVHASGYLRGSRFIADLQGLLRWTDDRHHLHLAALGVCELDHVLGGKLCSAGAVGSDQYARRAPALIGMHHEDGRRRSVKDRRAHAAEQDVTQPTPAAGSNDGELMPLPLDQSKNLVARISFEELLLDLELLCLQQAGGGADYLEALLPSGLDGVELEGNVFKVT